MSLKNGGDELIKISELSKDTPYTAEYLSLRARQGKLKAKKIGAIWYTTRAHINEYRTTQDARQNINTYITQKLESSEHNHQIRITSSQKSQNPWLIKWVAIPFALLIILGFLPLQLLYKSTLLSLGILNDLADDANTTISTDLSTGLAQETKATSFISNFVNYSKTLTYSLADRASGFFVRFYENHPTLLAASHSNFGALHKQISDRYGLTRQDSLSIFSSLSSNVATTVGQSVSDQRLVKDKTGQVAGAKDSAILLIGDQGTFEIMAGSQQLSLKATKQFDDIKLTIIKHEMGYYPKLTKFGVYNWQIEFTSPIEKDLVVFWQGITY